MRVLLVVVVALVAASSAGAARGEVWWDEERAVSVLLDSDLAFELEADDAECEGWGGYRLSRDETRTFRRFVCELYAERESLWCLPGECSTSSFSFTCRTTVRFRTASSKRFLIQSMRSRCDR